MDQTYPIIDRLEHFRLINCQSFLQFVNTSKFQIHQHLDYIVD